jgi:hypothetical protein
MEGKSIRLQFDVSPEAKAEYKKLQELTGSSTMKAFILNAICLLVWAVGEVMRGRSICSFSEKENRYTNLEMLEFAEVRRNAQKETEGK